MSEVPMYHCRRNSGRRVWEYLRKVDARLPGKGNPNSRGARPVHLIITMIKWIRTSSLSIKNSLCGNTWAPGSAEETGKIARVLSVTSDDLCCRWTRSVPGVL